jgi:anti-anti-sigma regulatory factor
METQRQIEPVRIQPEGRLGLEKANWMLEKIRTAEAGVELDLSRVDSIEVSMLQVILVTVASLRKKGQAVIVTDSDDGVLRAALALSGISPEQAGLSASLAL